MKQLTLYSRAGCCLCEGLESRLRELDAGRRPGDARGAVLARAQGAGDARRAQGGAAIHPRGASMRAVSRACSNWTASTPNKRGALHVLLDLASDVSFSEAKAAFQQKAKRCHPDLAASTGRSASSLQTEFVALQTAWENYLASLEGASSAAEVAAKREQEKQEKGSRLMFLKFGYLIN